MPYLHVYPLTVRHYECDYNGDVHYAAYLRYMQESAFSASSAVGYGEARYRELGYHWFAYETDIQYLSFLQKGDNVEIKTWVEDFRRVRSLRRYEMYRNGELAVIASTDWVLIDVATLSPTTIPPEIVEAYARGDDVELAPRRIPLPVSLPPKTGMFTQHRRVEWRDVDPAQHVNNAVYLDYVADSEMRLHDEIGWTQERFAEEGVALVTRRHQLEYKLAAVYGDALEVVVWTTNADAESFVRHFLVKRASDGKTLTRIRAHSECVNLKTGKACPIPRAYTDALADNIVTS
jgi:acyl-CoA thioester hydrolase